MANQRRHPASNQRTAVVKPQQSTALTQANHAGARASPPWHAGEDSNCNWRRTPHSRGKSRRVCSFPVAIAGASNMRTGRAFSSTATPTSGPYARHSPMRSKHLHPCLGYRQPHAPGAGRRQGWLSGAARRLSARSGSPPQRLACICAELGFFDGVCPRTRVAAGIQTGLAHPSASPFPPRRASPDRRFASPEGCRDRRCAGICRRARSHALPLGHPGARLRRTPAPGRGWQAVSAVS